MLDRFHGISKFYIAKGKTDLRMGIDGLVHKITAEFKLDPYDNTAFLFCGRSRSKIKILMWEDTGFVLLYKRFEAGKLKWPRNKEEVRALTNEQVNWLLRGLSIEQPNLIKNFTPIRKADIQKYCID